MIFLPHSQALLPLMANQRDRGKKSMHINCETKLYGDIRGDEFGWKNNASKSQS